MIIMSADPMHTKVYVLNPASLPLNSRSSPMRAPKTVAIIKRITMS